MASLYFSDNLRRSDTDPKVTKLIRHTYNDPGFRDCYNAGMLKQYTQQQFIYIIKQFFT